ncbi:MAG: PhnD/SsuA/transferrin family substrate-binding protein [Aestuariivita sp.]|nr:PhnD/SsuA/transferrin family substrate-binding protein [Aestuariivita sp.]
MTTQSSRHIAYLGMYDIPPIQAANDRFYRQIRQALGYGPTSLVRNEDPWKIWLDPNLLLAQTCSLPYRKALHAHVQLVGTPDYGLKDCPAGYYYSLLVCREKDPRTSIDAFSGMTLAYNDHLSQSGWAAPICHLESKSTKFGNLSRTGSHLASVEAVANHKADLAGIDAVSWRLFERHEPMVKQLRIVTKTKPTPGLPYITSQEGDGRALSEAVRYAIGSLSQEDRVALNLHSLEFIPAANYLQIPTPPKPSEILCTNGF